MSTRAKMPSLELLARSINAWRGRGRLPFQRTNEKRNDVRGDLNHRSSRLKRIFFEVHWGKTEFARRFAVSANSGHVPRPRKAGPPTMRHLALAALLSAQLLNANPLAEAEVEGQASVYYYRALDYAKKGDLGPAIADYDKAIELDPKYTVAYFNRGLAYGNKADLDHAIADFGKAIELDPKFAPAYNARAWTYFKAAKAAQGLPDVEKSLQLLPDDPGALDTRGHIVEALGRREEAIADFRRALAKAPDLQGSKEALKRLGASP